MAGTLEGKIAVITGVKGMGSDVFRLKVESAINWNIMEGRPDDWQITGTHMVGRFRGKYGQWKQNPDGGSVTFEDDPAGEGA
jgi:hypothetical protein